MPVNNPGYLSAASFRMMHVTGHDSALAGLLGCRCMTHNGPWSVPSNIALTNRGPGSQVHVSQKHGLELLTLAGLEESSDFGMTDEGSAMDVEKLKAR